MECTRLTLPFHQCSRTFSHTFTHTHTHAHQRVIKCICVSTILKDNCEVLVLSSFSISRLLWHDDATYFRLLQRETETSEMILIPKSGDTGFSIRKREKQRWSRVEKDVRSPI